jgi:hypothetical protein
MCDSHPSSELPKQLTDFYKAHNIKPNPRPVISIAQVRKALNIF